MADQQVDAVPLRLPPARRVLAAKNGASAPAVEADQARCAQFRVNVRDVREYLRVAKVVSEHYCPHALDWSPCYASGTVVFADGLRGVWGIQQLRAGSLKLSDGRELFLYCPRCKSRVFPAP